MAGGIVASSLTFLCSPSLAVSNEIISALTDQDQYVAGVEGAIINFSLTLSGRDPSSTESTKVVVTSYQPARSRADVRAAIAGDLPSTVDTVVIDTSTVRNNETGALEIAVPIEIGVRSPGALQMSASGVYPISIGLQQGKTVTSQIVTFVDRLPQDVTSPLPSENLRIALTGILDSAVSWQANATTIVSDSTRRMVYEALTILEASPSTPLSLAVRPELVDALNYSTEEDAALLSRLQVAGGLQALAATYVDIQPDESVDSASMAIFTDQLRLGEDIMTAALPNTVMNRDSWLQTTPLFAAGAMLLRNLGLRTVVLLPQIQGATAQGAPLFAEPTRLIQLNLPYSDRLNAALADSNLSALLTRGSQQPMGGSYLIAQQLLAELKMLRAEIIDRDETMSGRGVILSTESGSLPSTAMMAAMLATFSSQPDITMVALDDLLNSLTVSVVDGLPVAIDLPAQTPSNNVTIDPAVAILTARVAGFSSMLPDGDERAQQWQRVIDVLPARTLTTAQRNTYLNELGSQLTAIGQLILPPTSTTFTLGGRESSVRLSLRNDNASDLVVRVRLTSSKLTLSNEELLVTLPAAATTLVEIPVTAKSNGSFRVVLQLTTPEGNIAIGPATTFTARVNAIAGLGQLFTGIAVLLLLSWWVHHLRREHQRKRSFSQESATRHPTSEHSA